MGHLATEVDGSISVLAAGVGGVVIVYLLLKYSSRRYSRYCKIMKFIFVLSTNLVPGTAFSSNEIFR